jgi:hypothetical protein
MTEARPEKDEESLEPGRPLRPDPGSRETLGGSMRPTTAVGRPLRPDPGSPETLGGSMRPRTAPEDDGAVRE